MGATGGGGGAPDETQVAMLVSMGFGESEAVEALWKTGGSGGIRELSCPRHIAPSGWGSLHRVDVSGDWCPTARHMASSTEKQVLYTFLFSSAVAVEETGMMMGPWLSCEIPLGMTQTPIPLPGDEQNLPSTSFSKRGTC